MPPHPACVNVGILVISRAVPYQHIMMRIVAVSVTLFHGMGSDCRFLEGCYSSMQFPIIQEQIELISTVMTDEHAAYKNLRADTTVIPYHGESWGCLRLVQRDATSNYERRLGLLEWWLEKHRGVNKWHLSSTATILVRAQLL